MSIGGGLHDRFEPEPQKDPDNKAKAREWLFWAVMVFALIVAFQVSPGLVFAILLLSSVFAAVVYLIRQIKAQIKDILK
jgi:hypothetical protein